MEEQFIHQSRIRQVFFLSAIILLGCLLIFQLYTFLPAVLGALTLYIILRKWMFFLVEKRRWKKGLTAALLMVLTFLIILIPIWTLVQMMSSKITYVIQHSDELVQALQIVIDNIQQKLGINLISTENLNKLSNFVAQVVPKILGATFSTLVTIFFTYFILYFMLVNGRKLELGIYGYMPLKDENVNKIGKEMESIVMSNAIGIPLIGIMQGIVAIIGYYFLGVQEPWFWFVITCISAMLPVIGAAFAYVPLAIIFFANNQLFQGVFMLIYGFGVIGTVDNIFRFTLMRKIANVHPLITVFGVIIGIDLFGFVGLIFGPVLISIFILLLKIYSNEFIIRKQELIMKDH